MHSRITIRPSPRPLAGLAPTLLVLVLILVLVLLLAATATVGFPADARARAAARASADEWCPSVEELERHANGILTVVLSTRKQAGGNHLLPILVRMAIASIHKSRWTGFIQPMEKRKMSWLHPAHREKKNELVASSPWRKEKRAGYIQPMEKRKMPIPVCRQRAATTRCPS